VPRRLLTAGIVAGFLAILTLGMVGCGVRPLLSAVEVFPSLITPNADGLADVTRVSYRLTGSADLSIYIEDAQGARHYFRRDQRRSAGRYGVDFGGVVDGRMLADGQYEVVVEAVAGGKSQSIRKPLTLKDADVSAPELRSFGVYPQFFTPNQDGIDDRVTVSYYLTKPATVRVFIVGSDGIRHPLAEKEGPVKEGEVGTHLYDYEGGVDLGATPPPDGDYEIRAEAQDLVGNFVVVTSTLVISQGGVPRVDIVNAAVDFGPKIVPLGQTLRFTLTVQNVGTVPVRTTGPEPGITYANTENFNSLGLYEESGAWRIGIDYEGNSSGRPYPYRWALGSDADLTEINGHKYLMPGKRVQITGGIRIAEAPPDIQPHFWAGLIHEDVAITMDHVDALAITIEY
jgi:hypothetical protein